MYHTFRPYTILFRGKVFCVPMRETALVYTRGDTRTVHLECFPVYLGTSLHSHMYINCGCGYVGESNREKHGGCAYYMLAISTLGLGLLCDGAKDVHHYCPTCMRRVAYAKWM